MLADLVKRSERVRAGLVTPAEDAAIGHASASLDQHIKAYLAYLGKKRASRRPVSAHHRRNVEHNLRRIVDECGFGRLKNVTRRMSNAGSRSGKQRA